MPVVNGASQGGVTRLLADARSGDAGAMPLVCELLYGDLRQVARRRLRGRQPSAVLDTTSLVRESFRRLAGLGAVAAADRQQFDGYAARVKRSVIGDTIRRRNAARRDWEKAKLLLQSALG